MLYVWRPAETGVRESNNQTEQGEQRRHGGHLIHPTVKPSFPLHPSAYLYSQGQRGRQNFTLHIYFLAHRLRVKHTIPINKH